MHECISPGTGDLPFTPLPSPRSPFNFYLRFIEKMGRGVTVFRVSSVDVAYVGGLCVTNWRRGRNTVISHVFGQWKIPNVAFQLLAPPYRLATIRQVRPRVQRAAGARLVSRPTGPGPFGAPADFISLHTLKSNPYSALTAGGKW